MGQTRFIFARTFDFSIYLYAALIYLAMTAAIARVWTLAERRLTRHLKRAAEPVALGSTLPLNTPGPADLIPAIQAR